jgi:hypothetical protein
MKDQGSKIHNMKSISKVNKLLKIIIFCRAKWRRDFKCLANLKIENNESVSTSFIGQHSKNKGSIRHWWNINNG